MDYDLLAGSKNKMHRVIVSSAFLAAAVLGTMALVDNKVAARGDSPAATPSATAVPGTMGSVEPLDHSVIQPADPMTPDTTGASIAAYGS